jgi:uncharacterized protein YbjT (DUF2867 family)
MARPPRPTATCLDGWCALFHPPLFAVEHILLKQILVLGGSGFVGRSVCEKLAAALPSTRLVVPTRRLKHAQHLRALPTVDLVQADVHNDAELLPAMAGCDAVVNLIAILHGSEDDFQLAHVTLPRRIAKTCAAHGLRRLVHISALGVGPNAPSHYLRSKTAGEAALQTPVLDTTVLRPSVIFGAHDKFMNLFATLQAVSPILPLAGSSARMQPVWVEDVASAVQRCLQDAEGRTHGKVYECAGPTQYSLGELAHLAGRWSGHDRWQIPLPGLLGRMQAKVLSMLPGPTLMSPDNLDSLRAPNVASGVWPGLAELGITPSALEAIAPTYLGPAQTRLDRWRALAGRD